MKLPEEAAKHKILAVTRRNKEVMAVHELGIIRGPARNLSRRCLSDPKLMNHLKKGSEDVKAGRVRSLSEAYERLGF